MQKRNRGGVNRRNFIAGTAACGGLFLFGKSSKAFAEGKESVSGTLYNLCAGPNDRVYVSAMRSTGASAIDVFAKGDDGKLERVNEHVSTGTGPLEFNYPQGLAFNDKDELFVVDANNGRIQVLKRQEDDSFAFLRFIGELGPKPGQFHTPKGLACFNSQLYVADTRNHRVQILEQVTGQVVEVIGEHGEERGQFRRPADVAIGADGTIFVADSGNSRVQVISNWRKGSGQIELLTPPPVGGAGAKRAFKFPLTSIAVRGNSLYVMESTAEGKGSSASARISVYRFEDGAWQWQGDHSQRLNEKLASIKRPYSFSLAQQGGLYVNDMNEGLVHFINEG